MSCFEWTLGAQIEGKINAEDEQRLTIAKEHIGIKEEQDQQFVEK